MKDKFCKCGDRLARHYVAVDEKQKQTSPCRDCPCRTYVEEQPKKLRKRVNI